jgi:hypothetical protein
MATKRANPIRLNTRTLLGLPLFLALLWILLDPLTLFSDVLNAAQIRRGLSPAMDRWLSHRPSGYRVDVKGSIPPSCLIDGELSVRDGHLIELRVRETPFVPDAPLLPVDRSAWQNQSCPYEDLTVERMFERVETTLASTGAFGLPLTVQFDEGRGFITQYKLVRSSRGGIFGYHLGECCTWLQFDGFAEATP